MGSHTAIWSHQVAMGSHGQLSPTRHRRAATLQSALLNATTRLKDDDVRKTGSRDFTLGSKGCGEHTFLLCWILKPTIIKKNRVHSPCLGAHSPFAAPFFAKVWPYQASEPFSFSYTDFCCAATQPTNLQSALLRAVSLLPSPI